MTLIPFVRYDLNGSVVDWGRMQEAAIDWEKEQGIRIAKGGGSPDFWVDIATGEVREKTDNPAYLDGLVIRDVPNPSRVHIGFTSHDCTDGMAELEFTQPGTYPVKVTSLRHLDASFVVTVP